MGRKRTTTRSATELKMEEIARWQMLNKPVPEIAQLMGMTEGGVTEIIRHPRYREIRQPLVDKTFEPVDEMIKQRKADVMMEAAAPDAAEALIALLDRKEQIVGPDGRVHEVEPSMTDKRLAATAILDRAGYGPIQRKAVRQRIELDPMLAKMFAAAMSESTVRTIEAEVVEDESD